MAGIGQRALFSFPYVGARPREILGLTEAVEAQCDQFMGWAGTKPNGDPVEHFTIIWGGTSAPNLADFANVPVGTEIKTPKVASIGGYQRIRVQENDATDWNKAAKASV